LAAPRIKSGKRPVPSAFMIESTLWKPGLKVVNAIWFPSRDQAGPKSSARVLDSTANPVPSALQTQMRCGGLRLPSGCRRQVYARREPSGDQAGRVSSPGTSVRFTTFVPSVFTRKMSAAPPGELPGFTNAIGCAAAPGTGVSVGVGAVET
jgi:hypothetical protein